MVFVLDLPKTRSGKITQGTSTAEDPSTLEIFLKTPFLRNN